MLNVRVTGAPTHSFSLLATTLSWSELMFCASFNRACTVPTGMSRFVVKRFCCTKCCDVTFTIGIFAEERLLSFAESTSTFL
ncbi:hypothetical protein PR003_g19871 [Phytophthora rubi]|uniref:Uncharacterized protein n=1 Tax=Phytophthora rubi TaxID=129364 RepID=A0A6A3JUG4_9STRA|nr:hypothetical protein PR002_g20074 [Phytophthora rubi]KAE8997028.1 hypothetical protein PR001_g19697 [Phytophthora rubi]KAE9312001.1 hypothetical protein PR003_g19871 [Phytophthora rubi]